MKNKPALISVTLLALALIQIAILSVGCEAQKFRKIHVETPSQSKCFTVESWILSSSGVDVMTKECGRLFCSRGTYVLIEGECPFCE